MKMYDSQIPCVGIHVASENSRAQKGAARTPVAAATAGERGQRNLSRFARAAKTRVEIRTPQQIGRPKEDDPKRVLTPRKMQLQR